VLANKDEIIAANKLDLAIDDEAMDKLRKDLPAKTSTPSPASAGRAWRNSLTSSGVGYTLTTWISRTDILSVTGAVLRGPYRPPSCIRIAEHVAP